MAIRTHIAGLPLADGTQRCIRCCEEFPRTEMYRAGEPVMVFGGEAFFAGFDDLPCEVYHEPENDPELVVFRESCLRALAGLVNKEET